MKFKSLCFLVVSWFFIKTDCTCLNTSISPNVFRNFRLVGSTYVAMVLNSELTCASFCLYDIMCLSFNYRSSTWSCEFNHQTEETEPSQVYIQQGWINGKRTDFPQELIGTCAHHSCSRGSLCGPKGDAYFCLERGRCVDTSQGFPVYKGTHNMTVSGRTCQRWDLHFPHLHLGRADSPATMSTVGTMEAAGNRCLIEDGDNHPWCYTTDPAIRWEHCSIPFC